MADDSNSPPNSIPSRRRSSFAGQTFADIFGPPRTRPSVSENVSNPSTSNASPTQASGPITSAAAQAQKRRMSVNTLGLSGTQSLGAFGRRDSMSSANSSSIDESAVEDDVGPAQVTPSTPFGRRMSFGARALRDVKSNTGQGGGPAGGGATDKTNGRSSIASEKGAGGIPTISPDSGKKTNVNAPTTAKGRDSGYNWADNFRNRAERSASITSMSGSPGGAPHVRAKSVAAMQPPPVSEVPKVNVPDHFQERILKGDFYMD